MVSFEVIERLKSAAVRGIRIVKGGPRYGANLHVWDYWSRLIAFNDAGLRMRPGDPRIFADMDGTVPDGVYELDWDGDGTVQLKPGVRRGPKTWDVMPGGNRLDAITTGEVHGLSVKIPGAADSLSPYAPAVSLVRDTHLSTIRGMDWGDINDPLSSTRKPWDRRVPAWAQAQFARAAGCDLHYCVHHLASNSQVASDLRAIAAYLPGKRVRVELSNELANPGFPQYRYFRPNGEKPHVRIATHLKELWAIADRELPGYKRFVGGWLADPAFARKIIENLGGARVDSLGPATYFGPSPADLDRWDAQPNLSFDQIEAACTKRIEQDIAPKLEAHAELAKEVGADLVVYECGSDLKPRNAWWRDAALQFDRSEAMGRCVKRLRSVHKRCDVAEAMWYVLIADDTPTHPTPPFAHVARMGQNWRDVPKAREAFKL